MIFVLVAVLLTGAMLLIGGAVVALQSPPGERVVMAMGICGAVLILMALIAWLFLLVRYGL